MKQAAVMVGAALLAFTFATGCGGRSDEATQLAQKAHDQAVALRAATFAPSDWAAAEEVHQQALKLDEKGRHREASALLLKAKVRYERARDIARAKHDELEQEIERLRKTAELRCRNLDELIAAAGTRLAPARRGELEKACREIHEKIAMVAQQIEKDDFMEAKQLADAALRQVWEAEKLFQRYVPSKAS